MEHVRLTVSGPGELGVLESLSDWLRLDRDLRGVVRWQHAEPDPTHLSSGAVQALAVAVGSGGVLTVLASSLKAFLEQPRNKKVRIVVHGENGQVVEIDAERLKDQTLLALLREARHGSTESPR